MPPRITTRLSSHADIPFLLELRHLTMNSYLEQALHASYMNAWDLLLWARTINRLRCFIHARSLSVMLNFTEMCIDRKKKRRSNDRPNLRPGAFRLFWCDSGRMSVPSAQ